MHWRWFLTILLGLGWLLVAGANVGWLWDKLKAKTNHNSSPVALVGALFAIGALAACPWESSHKWALIVPALLLDFGSGPLVVLSVVALIGEAIGDFGKGAPGGYFSGIEKRVARVSLIIKLGVGFAVWYLLLAGALSEPGWVGRVLAVLVLAFWPVLLLWFWRLRRYSPREKKP